MKNYINKEEIRFWNSNDLSMYLKSKARQTVFYKNSDVRDLFSMNMSKKEKKSHPLFYEKGAGLREGWGTDDNPAPCQLAIVN